MGSISKGAETSRSEKETLVYTSPGSDLEPPQRKMAACPLEIELWRFVGHHFCVVCSRLGKQFQLRRTNTRPSSFVSQATDG